MVIIPIGLLMLSLYSGVTSLEFYSLLSSAHEKFQDQFFSGRLKREARDKPMDLMSMISSNCTLECADHMDQAFKKAFPNKTHFEGKIADDEFGTTDDKEYDKMCKAYKPASACLKKCSNYEFMKRHLVDSLEILEVLCITDYDDIKKYMPCVTKNRVEIRNACKPVCKNYEGAMPKFDQMMEFEHMPKGPEFKKDRKIIEDACVYLKCKMDCGKPKVTKLCAAPTVPLLNKILTSMFNSLNAFMVMASMAQENSTEVWNPVNCELKQTKLFWF